MGEKLPVKDDMIVKEGWCCEHPVTGEYVEVVIAGYCRQLEERDRRCHRIFSRLRILFTVLCCFAAAVILLLLVGCSSDDDQGTIGGAGDERSDRVRDGSTKKATMPNQDGDSTTTATSSGTCSKDYSSYGTRNGGRQAWRIPQSGPEFGSRVKVVFSDGHTVYVKDTSHNYRESDGFVFKPGIGPNGEGENDTGTAHGGVYLHAPYGNRSQMVKICSL